MCTYGRSRASTTILTTPSSHPWPASTSAAAAWPNASPTRVRDHIRLGRSGHLGDRFGRFGGGSSPPGGKRYSARRMRGGCAAEHPRRHRLSKPTLPTGAVPTGGAGPHRPLRQGVVQAVRRTSTYSRWDGQESSKAPLKATVHEGRRPTGHVSYVRTGTRSFHQPAGGSPAGRTGRGEAGQRRGSRRSTGTDFVVQPVLQGPLAGAATRSRRATLPVWRSRWGGLPTSPAAGSADAACRGGSTEQSMGQGPGGRGGGGRAALR